MRSQSMEVGCNCQGTITVLDITEGCGGKHSELEDIRIKLEDSFDYTG